MKTTAKYTAIAVIALLVGVCSVGCNDNPGPAGAPGAQGGQGAPGAAANPAVSEKSSESSTTTKTDSNAPNSGSVTTTEKSTDKKN
jgi:hypothetical protein